MFSLKDLRRQDAETFISGDTVIREEFSSEEWDCPEAYKMAGIVGYEPMLAKELEGEEVQDEKLNDTGYLLEEKFDGTRALVYFLSQTDYNTKEDIGFCRVFSRRVSRKTGFYVENTDSLPQIRELNIPELAGTILDGEMLVDGKEFKDVSSIMNCTWDKAIDRQIENGFISFHAFDILFYKGIDLRKMPLHRRKVYLEDVVSTVASEYVKLVTSNDCGKKIPCSPYEETHGTLQSVYNALREQGKLEAYPLFSREFGDSLKERIELRELSPRAFYEYIVASGGEGLVLKPKSGKYRHARGWEYSKIKKFLTRELIVLGFSEPTREYTGKDIRKWAYWVDKNNKRVIGNFYGDSNYTPVTKFYYFNLVGNLLLGVLISKNEYENLAKNKRGEVFVPSDFNLDIRLDEDYYIMTVCECSGYDDETREFFTKKKDSLVGTVVEVKANEIFKDSGRLRHPRYMRQRFDKDAERCTWTEHIGAKK